MTCPRCHSVLLFPDEDDRVSRYRICAICGWTQELDRHGAVLEPLPYNAGAEAEEQILRSGGRTGTHQARINGDDCLVSRDCTQCPLAECKHDNPRLYWDWVFLNPEKQPWHGKPPVPMTEELVRQEALRLQVTERTVWRRLKRMRGV